MANDWPYISKWLLREIARGQHPAGHLPEKHLRETFSIMLQCDFAQPLMGLINDQPAFLIEICDGDKQGNGLDEGPHVFESGDHAIRLMMSPTVTNIRHGGDYALFSCIHYFFSHGNIQRLVWELHERDRNYIQLANHTGFDKTGFSYTIEMLIQAGRKRMAVASVPIATNQVTRKSRLFKSIPNFIKRSVATMLRIYAMYQPLKVFAIVGAVLAVIGVLPIFRFLYFYAIGDGEGHVQSLILGGALVIIAVLSFLIGLVADLIAFNRQLLEITLEKVREMELNLARMEEDRRGAARAAARPEIGLAALHGEARLLARSIAERSGPGGTGRS
jgi:hypothetical protein